MVVAPWNILIEISSCELKDWLGLNPKKNL